MKKEAPQTGASYFSHGLHAAAFLCSPRQIWHSACSQVPIITADNFNFELRSPIGKG